MVVSMMCVVFDSSDDVLKGVGNDGVSVCVCEEMGESVGEVGVGHGAGGGVSE